MPEGSGGSGVSGRGSGSAESGSTTYMRWSAHSTNTTAGPFGPTYPANGLPPYSVKPVRTLHGGASTSCVPADSRSSRTRPPCAGVGAVHHSSEPTKSTHAGRHIRVATSRAETGETHSP